MNTKINVNYIRCAAIRVLLVALFSLCVNPLYAQIQTNILGCRLGVSSQSAVSSTLKQRGFNLIKSEGDVSFHRKVFYDTNDNVLFGGIYWENARIGFVNGKFSSILFQCKECPRSTFVQLLSALKSKYSRYVNYTVSDDNFVDFRDNCTEICLWYSSAFGVELSYGNISLEESAFGSGETTNANDL